jgi:hypothetical protein
VTIDRANMPSERSELCFQGLVTADLSRAAGNLQLVVIDNGDEVVESVVRRGHGRFPDGAFGKLAIVFGAVQALDGTVIGPKIVGGSVGLHPAWVILALAAGGLFFGFVGLLIAVPAALLVKLLAVRGLERYRTSRLYLTGSTEEPAA